ncbi:ribonuclease N [Nonomuraea sp. NN258]|uniref:ribonuclease domain-containing protein n=1 Tax=Nonomuraea antri TaxID=2730852 RepID=UPI00156875FC|nr:ribonuclease domain-containing protein [Nonomuraea antri]NRQ35884.1 ribonuclease N [Nonomuraea antri]
MTSIEEGSTRMRPRLPARLAAVLATAVSLTCLAQATTPAPVHAQVYDSCALPGCDDARRALSVWASKGYPANRGWHPWPGGQHNYSGGRFFDHERQLPGGRAYQEFDIYPRQRGAHRDAHRIVMDTGTSVTWYSPDHYRNFHRL